jgi:hypothetical protein
MCSSSDNSKAESELYPGALKSTPPVNHWIRRRRLLHSIGEMIAPGRLQGGPSKNFVT